MVQKYRKQVKNFEIEPTSIFALFTTGLVDVSSTLVSGYFHRDDHWKRCTKRTTSKVRLQLAQVELEFHLCKLKYYKVLWHTTYYNFLRRKWDFQWFLFMISTRTRTEDHFTLFIKFHLFSSMEQIFIFTEKLGKRTWSKLYWEDLESRVKHCGRCEI